MPSGYTEAIYNGEDIDFAQFALTCTRGMGVAVMQRDEPISSPLKEEYEPSDYHRKELSKAIARVQEYRALPLSEWEQREREDRDATTASVQEAILKAGTLRARYELMLAHVEAWRPPTPDHEGLKAFMVEQLTSSIKFDCSVSYLTMPPIRSAEEFRDEQDAKAVRDAEYHREEWQKEQERTASRNQWVRDLRASLAAPATRR